MYPPADGPKYPVVDPNPSFRKVIGNLQSRDYLWIPSMTSVGVSTLFAIESGIQKTPARPFSVLANGALCGLMIGIACAFSSSCNRLRGYSRNEREVAQCKIVNSDNVELVKPKYPVVDPDPLFTKIVGNFIVNVPIRECPDLAAAANAGFTGLLGYHLATRIFWKRGSMPPVTELSLGFNGVLCLLSRAYEISADRLKGFLPNDKEVAWYMKAKTDNIMVLDSDEEPAGQLNGSFPNEEEVDQCKK